MIKKNKFGFTLVELLAVIVILAVILVIAVPKVLNIIESAKKATLESTAKMIASMGEKVKVQNQVLGKDEEITCENVTKLNDVDYERCNLEFDGNTALVTIKGKNKFEGLYICKGTKNDSKVVDYCPNEKVLVEIDPAGGSVEDLSGIYKEGDKIELLIPTKENNTFLSWNVVKGNSTIEDNILTVGSADTIVYALYEAWNKLEVDLNEGIDNVEYEEYYKSGTTIELTEPTRENYKFVGWQLIEGNSVLSGSTLTMGSENTKVKAIWELLYTYLFNYGTTYTWNNTAMNPGSDCESSNRNTLSVKTNSDGSLKLTQSKDYSGGAYTVKVDLTDYSSVIFEGSMTSDSTSTHWGIWSALPKQDSCDDWIGEDRVKSKTSAGTIDVSSLKGSYYIGFYCYKKKESCSITVKTLKLVK